MLLSITLSGLLEDSASSGGSYIVCIMHGAIAIVILSVVLEGRNRIFTYVLELHRILYQPKPLI